VRVLDVVLDRHQAFLAHLGKDLEKHRQQIDIQDLGKLRPLEDPRQRADGRLDDLQIVAGDEAANRQTDDGNVFKRRNVFKRHPQRSQATVHRVGAKCRRQNDYVANDKKHPPSLVIARCALAKRSSPSSPSDDDRHDRLPSFPTGFPRRGEGSSCVADATFSATSALSRIVARLSACGTGDDPK